jgi:hypothetical protein
MHENLQRRTTGNNSHVSSETTSSEPGLPNVGSLVSIDRIGNDDRDAHESRCGLLEELGRKKQSISMRTSIICDPTSMQNPKKLCTSKE